MTTDTRCYFPAFAAWRSESLRLARNSFDPQTVATSVNQIPHSNPVDPKLSLRSKATFCTAFQMRIAVEQLATYDSGCRRPMKDKIIVLILASEPMTLCISINLLMNRTMHLHWRLYTFTRNRKSQVLLTYFRYLILSATEIYMMSS